MKPFDVYHLNSITPQTAKGFMVYDQDGRAYLDFYGGHAVISIGHSHPQYVAALTAQINKIGFYSNAVQNNLQVRLAEKLGQISGYQDYRLFLCNSGAEANENAIKLASFHTRRKKVVAIRAAFHGRTSLALALTDNPSIRSVINNGIDVSFIALNKFEEINTIDYNTCAVIIEGIQGVAGIYVPDDEYLQALSNRCKEVGAQLILDEVQSGYGRTGSFFAHQHAGIRPPLITVAKGMGNGFPIAGVLIGPEFEAVKEQLGTTFGGNYLACVAGISVLDIIEEEKLMHNCKIMSEYIMDALQQIKGVVAVRGRGLMIGIELQNNAAIIRKKLLEEYRIVTGAASQKNTIRLLPPLTITKDAIITFINAFKQVLHTHE
jgi:acetylornithine aminotransferase